MLEATQKNTAVCAVVVTYNRKILLLECLEAILHQSVPVDRLVIVDNHSTDDTVETLRQRGYLSDPRVELVSLPDNQGGAGGFHEGMKQAHKSGAEWVWIMDDDTIPTETCLEELLNARSVIKGKVSFLASAVRGMNGEAMNVPKITRKQFNSYTDWYEYLGDGIAQIVKATFVSLLIHREAIDACGYPWKPFFLWGDDSEYTQRVIRDYGPAYMVGKSLAIHKRASSDELSLVKEENPNRIRMYFYYYRNNLIGFWEYENWLYRFLCMGKLGYDFVRVLLFGSHKLAKMGVILKAFFAFVFGTYDRRSFRERAKL